MTIVVILRTNMVRSIKNSQAALAVQNILLNFVGTITGVRAVGLGA